MELLTKQDKTKQLYDSLARYGRPGTLPVTEAFYTVQGEGAYAGRAAYFLRLAGCDVGCVWCDVKESWTVDKEQFNSVEKLVAEAASYPSRMIVITGGEPLMHDLTDLTARLKTAGFRVHLETSGAHELTGQIDWLCLSPKKFKQPLPDVYSHTNELKVVIFNGGDFDWAEQHAAKVGADCRLFLQPEWGRRAEMMPEVVEYVKHNPQWGISLQTHNYMRIP